MIFGTINSRGNTETILECNLNKLPSSDPLAFGYGISRGQQAQKLSEYDKVAEGTKIKKGQEQCYALFDKNILKK